MSPLSRFNAWLEKHFFRASDPRSLGLFRFLYCVALLWFITHDHAKYIDQFSGITWHPIPLFELFHVPLMSVELYECVYWALVVSLALTAVGACTRVAGTVAWISFFFYVGMFLGFGKTPGTNYVIHSQNICVMVLFILSIAPGVGRYGIDGLWSGKWRPWSRSAPEPTSVWPLQLIKLTLGLAYFGAGYCKIVASIFWADGHTLQAHLISKYLLIDSEIGLWVAQHFWLCLLLGVATLILELSFVLVVFYPRLTWLYVVGAMCFHLAIFLTMHINFFPYFGCTFLIFLDWPTLRALTWPVRKTTNLFSRTGESSIDSGRALTNPATIFGDSTFARFVVVGFSAVLLGCVIGRVESWPFTDYRVFQSRMKLSSVRVYRLAAVGDGGEWTWVEPWQVPITRMSLNSRVRAHIKQGGDEAARHLISEMAACLARHETSDSITAVALIERTVYRHPASGQLHVVDRPLLQTALPGFPADHLPHELAQRDQPLVR